jgi:hypothetical protein
MRHSKGLIIIGGIILIVVLLVLGGCFVLKTRADVLINKLIERNLPPNIVLTYESTSVNLFTGSISMENVRIEVFNSDGIDKYADLEMKALKMEGFSYVKFVLWKRLFANSLTIDDPAVRVHPYLKDKNPNPRGRAKRLRLGKFAITNGSIFIMQDLADTLLASAQNIEVNVSDLLVTTRKNSPDFPFRYGDHTLKARNVYLNLGLYERMDIASIDFNNRQLGLDTLTLESIYSRRDLSRLIDEEHEHISAEIANIQMSDVAFGLENDTPFFSSPYSSVAGSDIVIYLDKREADRTKEVKMYSKVLRDLPINLTLDTIKAINGVLLLETLNDSKTKIDRLFFDSIQADFYNISNTYPPGQLTRIHATSLFMVSSPTFLEWSFDMNNEQDEFSASGGVVNYKSRYINKFHLNNQIISANGAIDLLSFSIRGNAVHSTGKMQMKYDNFKFRVYRADGKKVKRIFSALGNLVVRDGSRSDEEGFRHGTISATRDPYKSFFNFLWISVFDGVKHTMTGSGKEK